MNTSLQAHTAATARNEAGRFSTVPSLHGQLAPAHERAFANPLRAIRAFESGPTRSASSARVETLRTGLRS